MGEEIVDQGTPKVSDSLLGGDNTPPEGTPAPEGTPEGNWIDKIPEAYRENPNVSKYKSQEDFMNGHLSLVKKVGEKGLSLPEKNSSDDDMQDFYSKIGRPEKAEDYTKWVGETVEDAEGNQVQTFQFEESREKDFNDFSHSIGLRDEQRLKMMDYYSGMTMQMQDDMLNVQQDVAEKTQNDLRKEWGDDYGHKMQDVQATVKNLGILDDLNELGLGNNYNAIKMVESISKKIGESGIKGINQTPSSNFDDRIKALKDNDAFNDKSHPDHKAVKANYISLFKERQESLK